MLNKLRKKQLLSRGINSKIFASLCLLLLFVYIVPHVVPQVFATSDTVTNIHFDQTTGYITFDYSGNEDHTDAHVNIENTAESVTYWQSSQSTCTSTHCSATLTSSTSDSGVTQVHIVWSNGSGSTTLSYPFTTQPSYADGWIPAAKTLIYYSADAPSYTFYINNSGNWTNEYYPGERVRLYQPSNGGIKYFIITAVSFQTSTTYVTVYGGSDYTLTNDNIYEPYLSPAKAPPGFPLDPAKWTVETENTSDNSQASPTQGTWYNLGSVSIAIPIGAWQVSYQVAVQLTNSSAGTFASKTTLSTANNSESDIDFSTYQGTYVNLNDGYTAMREKNLTLTSKTTYYLNTRSENANLGTLYNLGLESPIIIKAVSAYL